MNKLPNNQTIGGRQPDVDVSTCKSEKQEPEQSNVETQPTPETNTQPDPPHIWVGSLSDYNNGVLHGEWIDATGDEDDVYRQIAEMLASSPTTAEYGEPAEEYGIFDTDNFLGLEIGEYDRVSQVTRLARLVAEHGEAFAAWAGLDRDAATADDAGERFVESCIGRYDSKEDYARVLLEDLGVTAELDEAMNPILRGYVTIDYAMLVRDLELMGNVTFTEASDGGWWAFVE